MQRVEIPSGIVDIWQRMVDAASVILSVPSIMINRLEPPELEVFRSNIGPQNPFPSGTRMQAMGVYCEAAARKRQRLQIDDARKDPAWSDSPTARAGIFAYLGFPVFWPSGEVFGTVCAVDTREKHWDGASSDLLGAFKEAIEAHLALATTLSQLDERNHQLQETLAQVRTLQGLLPICASCKRIRDDKGYWNEVETYIGEHSEARFSHGICPECFRKLYPDLDNIR